MITEFRKMTWHLAIKNTRLVFITWYISSNHTYIYMQTQIYLKGRNKNKLLQHEPTLHKLSPVVLPRTHWGRKNGQIQALLSRLATCRQWQLPAIHRSAKRESGRGQHTSPGWSSVHGELYDRWAPCFLTCMLSPWQPTCLLPQGQLPTIITSHNLAVSFNEANWSVKTMYDNRYLELDMCLKQAHAINLLIG